MPTKRPVKKRAERRPKKQAAKKHAAKKHAAKKHAAKKPAAKEPAAKKQVMKPASAATTRATTTTDTIAWTEKLRARTFASRTHPNPRHLTGSMDKGPMWVAATPPYSLDATWKRLLGVTWSTATCMSPLEAIPIGYASATPKMAALAKRALEAHGRRLEKLDADVEAAMAILRLRRSYDGVILWFAMHGVVFATKAMIAMARLRGNVGNEVPQEDVGMFLLDDGDADGATIELQEHHLAWKTLRGMLAVASDSDYAAARNLANDARGVLPAASHAALAFAFPDEDWTEGAIEAHLSLDEVIGWEAWQMLMSVSSLRDALKIASEPYPIQLPFALTMLAKHGAATTSIIAKALDVRAQPERFSTLGQVLAMIRTPEALEAFLPVLGFPPTKKWLEDAFAAQPVIGKKLLAKAAKKSGKEGKAALALLATLD